MRAFVLEMPKHWIEERRRLGHDKRDEVWDGVLHMVPTPGTTHQTFSALLLRVLSPLAESRGLQMLFEINLLGAAGWDDYRVPDLVIFDPRHTSERGIEQRAEVVIEILSPNDESRDKLPFYASCGIPEVWLIDPKTRALEILSLTDQYSTPGTESAVLGIRFSVSAGPKLRLEWPGGSTEI